MWYIPKIVVLCTKLFNIHFAPFLLWKEIEYHIWSSQACKGFMLPLPCSWCYELYHIVFLGWICIECMSSEPLWKMYLHGNKHFLNLNLNLNYLSMLGLKLAYFNKGGPGARFTNGFLPAIQIRWKLHLATIPLLAIRSQRNFAHATTAQLSCHVQHFVAITVSESRWEWNGISIEFELRWKNR